MADAKWFLKLKFWADIAGLAKSIKWMDKSKKAAKLMGRAVKATFKGIRTGVGVANRGLRRLSGTIAAVTLAMGAMAIRSAKLNISLAQAVNMFDGSLGTFRYFRREIRDVATDTGIAQESLIASLYKIGSARIPKENAIAFMRVAARAFIADGANMEAVIQGLAAVLGPFKMKYDQAGIAADKLYSIVKGGQTTFEEVGEELNKSATAAAKSGMAFDQLAAGITTMTAATVKTPTALVSMRNMISILNKELGDGWTKTMSFQGAMKKLWTTKGESISAIQKIFGMENYTQALLFMGDSAEKAAADLKEMQKSTGEGLIKASEFVRKFMHWGRVSKEIENHIDAIGERFDRVLGPYVDRITAKMKTWRNNTSFFDIMEAKLGAAAEKVEAISAAISMPGKEGKDARDEIIKGLSATMQGIGDILGRGVVIALMRAVPAIAYALGRGMKAAFMQVGENNRDKAEAVRRVGAERNEEYNKLPRSERSLKEAFNIDQLLGRGTTAFLSDDIKSQVHDELRRVKADRFASEGDSIAKDFMNNGGNANFAEAAQHFGNVENTGRMSAALQKESVRKQIEATQRLISGTTTTATLLEDAANIIDRQNSQIKVLLQAR